MEKTKTIIGFRVSQEVSERVKRLFPEGRTEAVLTSLLDEFENPAVTVDDSEVNQCQEIIDSICNIYSVEPIEILGFINILTNNLQEFKATNIVLKDEFSRVETEMERLKLKCEVLELDNQQINWGKIRTTLQPFTVTLLENTAVKLSEKYDKEVQPMQILVDMFMRYTIERWNQWFYPFQLKDTEILTLVSDINPEITSISQLKKTLPK